MSNYLEVSTEIFNRINDAEFDLTAAKASLQRAVIQIEQKFSFEYMLKREVVIRSANTLYVTVNEWKRRTEVRLYVLDDNSVLQFAHRLKWAGVNGVQVPINYISNQPTPSTSTNRNIPYYYSLGKYTDTATASLDYESPLLSGRVIQLFPEADEKSIYQIMFRGFAMSKFDLASATLDTEVSWLFDYAEEAVIAKAMEFSTSFTRDYESIQVYRSNFQLAAEPLFEADLEEMLEEGSSYSMEYQGENVGYRDSTQMYPPDWSRTRVITDGN